MPLKKNCNGYDAWIISSDMNALKFIGLKPTRKIPVFNGPLECRFMKFSIYEGSKKDKIQPTIIKIYGNGFEILSLGKSTLKSPIQLGI